MPSHYVSSCSGCLLQIRKGDQNKRRHREQQQHSLQQERTERSGGRSERPTAGTNKTEEAKRKRIPKWLLCLRFALRR